MGCCQFLAKFSYWTGSKQLWTNNSGKSTLGSGKTNPAQTTSPHSGSLLNSVCMEWQSSLYINFVDFEKAFDSLDRVTLWKLLRKHGTCMRGLLYKSSARANSQLASPSEQEYSRVVCCPHCTLPDRHRLDHEKNHRTGIQWPLFTQLEDLDFADDLGLVSWTHAIEERLQVNSGQLGLRISTGKTKVMKINLRSSDPVIPS